MRKNHPALSTLKTVIILLGVSLATGCDSINNKNHTMFYDELTAQQLQGRWTIINYWAGWCKPCLEEMPELNRLHQQLSESPKATNAQIFAVNFDDLERQALRIESQKLNVQVPLIINDPSTSLGFSKPTVLPTTLIFNPQGKLQHTLLGPQTLQGLSQLIGLTAKP